MVLCKIPKKLIQDAKCWKPKIGGFSEIKEEKNRVNSWFTLKIKKGSNIQKPVKKEIKTGVWKYVQKKSKRVKQGNLVRAEGIILKPNTKQREFLLNWFEVYRQSYNHTIKYFKLNRRRVPKCRKCKRIKHITKRRRFIENAIKEYKKKNKKEKEEKKNKRKPKKEKKEKKNKKKPKKEKKEPIKQCQECQKKQAEYEEKREKGGKFTVRTEVMKTIRANTWISKTIKKYDVLRHTIVYAIFDAWAARKSAISNLKAGNIKYFRMRYKKKSHHLKTMVFEHADFNEDGTGLKNPILYDLHLSKSVKITKDTRINYNTRNKRFTLYHAYDKVTETEVYRNKVCSMDPGIRTFQTVYSPSGVCYQIGDEKNIVKKSVKLIEKADRISDPKKYKKYVNRLRVKLKNRVDDMHWKVANFLCRKFDNILIGNMSTKSIIKTSGNLDSLTKRTCLAQSHFLFKQRLASKAEEYNVNFHIVDESYTSKTCGDCSEINDDLGGSKIFKCINEDCDYIMERDVHGGRNIYIKNEHIVC